MDRLEVEELVCQVAESFMNPGAARRFVPDQHPRDKDGKFSSGGGESPEVERVRKLITIAVKHGNRAIKKRAKAAQLQAKADKLHDENQKAIAAYKKKYGKDPITGKKVNP